MAETETTQRTWQAVMGGNPSDWSGEDHPVERVSHADALAFCAKLSQDGVQVRLPSEAEWEYACRAGSVKAFASFQGDLDAPYAAAVGWMRGSSDGHGRVAQRQPNRLGLFDLHGNVWEWCGDRYGMYSPTPVEDPRGTTAATWNIRGGSWGDKPERCRAANRQQADGGLRSAYLGFRMVIGDRPETAAP
jgi:formylglycine-generating enzyme required for sulfatase activity